MRIDLVKRNAKISKDILRGEPIKNCSEYFNISLTRCSQIVRNFCHRSNKDLYDALLHNISSITVPIALLKLHADEFLSKKSKEEITGQTSIWYLENLSILTLKGLEQKGIKNINDLSHCDITQLKRMPKIGKKGIESIQEALSKHGFSLVK